MANANQIVQVAGADPLASLLNSLAKVPETTTTTSNTGSLQQLLAQLTKQATPGGSSDLIKQIFNTGNATGQPVINNQVTGAGIRGGKSSYQVLAQNDLQARLAGQSAVALQSNATAATNAAAQLAAASRKVTTGPSLDLATLLPQVGIGMAASVGAKAIGKAYDSSAFSKTIDDKLAQLFGTTTEAGIGATTAADIAAAAAPIDLGAGSAGLLNASMTASTGATATGFTDAALASATGATTAAGSLDALYGTTAANSAAGTATAAATAAAAAAAGDASIVAGIDMFTGDAVATAATAAEGATLFDTIATWAAAACFITTACCEVMGEADDGTTLTTLRNFRDTWLHENHPAAIKQYYAEAPAIVAAIKRRLDAKAVFTLFYNTYIMQSVAYINTGDMPAAYETYVSLFNAAKVAANIEELA